MNYYFFQSLVWLSESSLKDSNITSMNCLDCGEKNPHNLFLLSPRLEVLMSRGLY